MRLKDLQATAAALLVAMSGNIQPALAQAAAQQTAAAPTPKLTAHGWATIGVLVLLVPLLALSSVGNQEIFNAYELWGDKTFQLTFFGVTNFAPANSGGGAWPASWRAQHRPRRCSTSSPSRP